MSRFTLKLDGVDGEGPDGLIDIIGVSHGFGRPASMPDGQANAGNGVPRFAAILISKRVDAASPSLARLCAGGNNIGEGIVTAIVTENGEDRPFYEMTLKNVRIGSVQVEAGSRGGSGVDERIELSFEEIDWVYTKYGANGSATPIKAGYDLPKRVVR